MKVLLEGYQCKRNYMKTQNYEYLIIIITPPICVLVQLIKYEKLEIMEIIELYK